MKPPRQSILRRKAAPASVKNSTTFDDAFEKEISRLQYKSEQYSQREYERLRAIYGDKEDKREIQLRLREGMDQLMMERKRLEQEDKESDRQYAEELEDQIKFSEFVEADHQQARYEYERFLMRDNMRQVEERRVAEEATKEQEKDRISKEGDCFFEGHWMRSFR